ncbi:MAG: hypothetical protein OER96_08560, partial [Gammaproteobacteria bacterium]|nr:hypothetical protein [Gammaproteobacteria bacterium]
TRIMDMVINIIVINIMVIIHTAMVTAINTMVIDIMDTGTTMDTDRIGSISARVGTALLML